MPIQLNLGCGDQQLPGYIGLDRLRGNGVDVICDLNYPLPIAANSVDHVYAKSLLEHIADLEQLLAEVQRVLKLSGEIYFYVPHWNNPFYYSDYTHLRFFGLASFDYFAAAAEQRFRNAPTYTSIRFKQNDVRLLFKSPFRWLHFPLKGLQWFVNRKTSRQLFYEYHLSAFIPCYAIEFTLSKNLDG